MALDDEEAGEMPFALSLKEEKTPTINGMRLYILPTLRNADR